MRRPTLFAVTLALAWLLAEPVSACGDKFLQIGRGLRFQHVYAAIHPARILLVLPPKSVKQAAVRDSRLKDALKMAGHHVDTTAPATLVNALREARYDLILAERIDALAIVASAPEGSAPPPTVIGVMEEATDADLASARQRIGTVLNAPQPLPAILRLLDDVMAARAGRVRAAAF